MLWSSILFYLFYYVNVYKEWVDMLLMVYTVTGHPLILILITYKYSQVYDIFEFLDV